MQDAPLQPLHHSNTAAMRETHFLIGKYGPEWNTTANDNFKSHKIGIPNKMITF
jgi:hypothetical protein